MHLTTSRHGALECVRVDHPHGGCTVVVHGPEYDAVLELDAAALRRWRDRRLQPRPR